MAMAPDYLYNATVGRWIDGDTVVLVVELGFFVMIRVHCRLTGINTPEVKKPGGAEATVYSERFAPAGSQVVIHSTKADKYGRFLVDIYHVDGDNLNHNLLATGLAEVYKG
jgi:micrococcal nuclease